MVCKEEARIIAILKIADLVGKEYFRSHWVGSCQAYTGDDDVEYEYFLGFEGDDEKNLWTVFARVSVNRETEEAIFLDYKTPDGHRMENPIKKTSFA